MLDATGPLLFARYAYAPNELGYCGPADHRAMLEYGAGGVVDGGLRQLAQGFGGAWPYLQLIAGANGIGDPLDRRVVEAYWVGNELLDRIDLATFGHSLAERFAGPAGRHWRNLAETIPAGGSAHHSFHVLCVYPWAGMLGEGRGADRPLQVLDQCRIRWGQVVSASGGEVVVRSRPLCYEDGRLSLGPERTETATAAVDGLGFATDLQAGNWVSLHWRWVCDRLAPRQLRRLRGHTARTLRMVNERLSHPGPAAALG
ncbi:MAG: DUF6390 family protein [Pseudonocardiaceae bacterium]